MKTNRQVIELSELLRLIFGVYVPKIKHHAHVELSRVTFSKPNEKRMDSREKCVWNELRYMRCVRWTVIFCCLHNFVIGKRINILFHNGDDSLICAFSKYHNSVWLLNEIAERLDFFWLNVCFFVDYFCWLAGLRWCVKCVRMKIVTFFSSVQHMFS